MAIKPHCQNNNCNLQSPIISEVNSFSISNKFEPSLVELCTTARSVLKVIALGFNEVPK